MNQDKPATRYIATPDGRYFVARGTMLRCSNPNLSPDDRKKYSDQLVIARKEEQSAKMWGPPEALQKAHRKVDAAKQLLGERGKPWWTDGAPDYSRERIEDTPYAEWWDGLADKTPPQRLAPKPTPKPPAIKPGAGVASDASQTPAQTPPNRSTPGNS